MQTTSEMNYDIILYHNRCPDGIGGAWVIWHFQSGVGDYKGMAYGYEVDPEEFRDKRVIMIDFTFKRDVTLAINKATTFLTILDHHASAQKELEGIQTDIVFDMKRSGAQIAWDHFTPEARPWFIDYIADRDLWNWSLPHSKSINEALYVGEHFNFEKLEELYKIHQVPRDLINKGCSYLYHKDFMIEEICARSEELYMKVHKKEYTVRVVTPDEL